MPPDLGDGSGDGPGFNGHDPRGKWANSQNDWQEYLAWVAITTEGGGDIPEWVKEPGRPDRPGPEDRRAV